MKKAFNVASSMFSRATATEEERTGFVDKEHTDEQDYEPVNGSPGAHVRMQYAQGAKGAVLDSEWTGGYQSQMGAMKRGVDGEGDTDLPEQESHGELAESEKKKITEWQAGWNVTNAIQVSIFDKFKQK